MTRDSTAAGIDTNDPLVEARPQAHRRIGLVGVLYGYRAIAGFVLAVPASIAIERPLAGYPRGGLGVFDVGGLMLLETVRYAESALRVVLVATALFALVLAAVGLLPTAAAIAGLGRQGRISPAWILARAGSRMGPVAILGLGALLAQAVMCALLVLGGYKMIEWLSLPPDRETLAIVALAAVTCILAAFVGMGRDLAWVAAIHGNASIYDSSAFAVRTVRRPAVVAAWAWRGGIAIAALALGLLVVPHRPGTVWIVVRVLYHQLGVVLAVFARVSWFAAAIAVYNRAVVQPEA